MSNYLSQAEEGITKRDWGFVLFCLTRHFSLPDPDEKSFDEALDILKQLIEPQVINEVGQEKMSDFLKKIPVRFQGRSEYQELLSAVQGRNAPQVIRDVAAIREAFHEGHTELISLVDEGLSLLYSHDYDKAIARFEQVLAIDPTYESAKEYLQDAREYKSGKQRPPRLSQDITLPLGRAMSMIRAEQYAPAHEQLELVFKAINEEGITEWQALIDLFQEVTDGINAEKQFDEAKKLFGKGDMVGAREKARQAYKLLLKPLYEEFIEEIDNFRNEISVIRAVLTSSGSIDNQIHLLLDSESHLNVLIVKYPDNELLQRLKGEIHSQKSK